MSAVVPAIQTADNRVRGVDCGVWVRWAESGEVGDWEVAVPGVGGRVGSKELGQRPR